MENLNESVLIENNFSTGMQIEESFNEAGQKSLHMVGPFIQTEIENQNKRIYPAGLMETAVQKYTEEKIDKNLALGELNHPESRMDIDPERACILIKELKKDGNFYIGKAKVLSTPLGKLVESLMNDGVTLGVSTRGTGGLKGNKVNKFNLKTVDVVSDPSAQTAFVNSLMEAVNEKKSYIFEIESLHSRVAELEESLRNGSYKSDKSFLDAISGLKI